MDLNIKVVETDEEVAAVVEYGRNFWVQTRYHAAGVEYDTASVEANLRHIMQTGLPMFAVGKDGQIVAILLIVVAPFPMNANVLQAVEWAFYVQPEYRAGGLGKHMLQQAAEVLRSWGIKFFTMVSLANVTPEAANRLYERMGFAHSETSFTKDLQGPQE